MLDELDTKIILQYDKKNNNNQVSFELFRLSVMMKMEVW